MNRSLNSSKKKLIGTFDQYAGAVNLFGKRGPYKICEDYSIRSTQGKWFEGGAILRVQKALNLIVGVVWMKSFNPIFQFNG